MFWHEAKPLHVVTPFSVRNPSGHQMWRRHGSRAVAERGLACPSSVSGRGSCQLCVCRHGWPPKQPSRGLKGAGGCCCLPGVPGLAVGSGGAAGARVRGADQRVPVHAAAGTGSEPVCLRPVPALQPAGGGHCEWPTATLPRLEWVAVNACFLEGHGGRRRV